MFSVREARYDAPIRETRPGVVKKAFEMPTELWMRIRAAAQARGVYPSTLWRAIAVAWLQEHSELPGTEANPARSGMSLMAARSPSDNSAIVRALGPRDPTIAKIFGFDK